MRKSQNKNKKKTPFSDGQIPGFFAVGADIMYRIGLPGFIVLAIVVFIFSFATTDQKHAIIERWVLFNNNNNSSTFAIAVIIIAILGYIIEAYAFSRIRKLDKEEIYRLSELKTKYQEELLKRQLASSVSPSKPN